MKNTTKNRLAIVHCVHHKPWLIMSTLITTLAQNYQDFDIYFLHQVGQGEKYYGNKYKEYFDEYYKLVDRYGMNQQLDSYDQRTKNACNINRPNIYQIDFENDHGLDSGAWYKFIKKKLWIDYEYILFMGEGALLTTDSVLKDTLNFVSQNNIHFVTGSQEKRRIPKNIFINGFASSKNQTSMSKFHDKMIDETFAHFRRDPDFENVYKDWSSDFKTEQENHVPDVWVYKGSWLKRLSLFNPNFNKKESLVKEILKYIYFSCNKLHSYLLKRESIKAIKLNTIKKDRNNLKKNSNHKESGIFVDTKWTNLSEVVSYQKEGNLIFHSSNMPEWFGATCNHLVSKEFLIKFSDRLEKYHIYDVLDLPFSATALEIIWGQIPLWLGYEKYFFDGIHRVRKNFINYRREDDLEGMVKYINRYYLGKIVVESHGDYIKVLKCSDSMKGIMLNLNDLYS